MSFAGYFYRVTFLKDEHIYFPEGVRNGEDLIFKYQAFLAARAIRYTGQSLYFYRYNDQSVTHRLAHYAPTYYQDLIQGWKHLYSWAASRDDFDSKKMADFAQQKIAHTCLWCAKNYCQWHNGSYEEFRKNILFSFFQNEYLQPLLQKCIEKETDEGILNDFQLLKYKPRKFYQRYYLEGSKNNAKTKIKSILKLLN